MSARIATSQVDATLEDADGPLHPTVKAAAEGKLKCAECGRVVGGSETKSWAAYLTIDRRSA